MTKKSLAAVLAATLVGIAACSDGGSGGASPSAGPASGARAERCDPGLDKAFGAWERAGFSGTVAIARRGRFACLAGYGRAEEAAGRPHTADTVFSIGSVTKAVTAATVYRLVDDGELALDDRVGDLLPELSGPVAEVTVRQLLLHTSGLDGTHGQDHRPLSRAAALTAIGRMGLAFEPGSHYAYSNAGYTLLALIIDEVSGRGYRPYTEATLLRLPGGERVGGFWDGRPKAVGPRAVGYLEGGRTGARGDFDGPHWALEGNGGLAMSARDLALWTQAVFGGRLVSARSTAALRTVGHDHGGGRGETPGWVAYDASRFGKPVLASAGGGGDVGHDVVVLWVPEDQQVVVIASNRPEVPAEELARKVGPALLADEPLPTPRLLTNRAPGAQVAAGRYALPTGGTFRVSPATSTDGGLQVTARGIDAVGRLFPPSDRAQAKEFEAMERRVRALLAGTTSEGRAERASVEKSYGRLRKVELAGTIHRDGDVRTYLTLTTAERSVTGWYAVDEAGGVIAAEVPTRQPALTLLPAGGGRYRPQDPTDAGPRVTVRFTKATMTLTGPAGDTVTATTTAQ
ncbi:serine hydrolase domain-containing protein [Streptomyces sp. 796.1]|uniref:serine hydrolase domain-containing protein n=1 Tax=Streptomyces sp. 796.1 TaxID=3163029 RepID=UPI0039C8CEFA